MRIEICGYPELKACPTAPSPICIDEFSLTI
eukprot:CCRYP_013494-RA/>CCRYP_013494-RA protein AED:0.00 eAED:0.00 QI:118/1/0.5/1/0/0/2/0/30